jgi:alpha-tubulin suppressor-like RCC1 family protein/tetratricopeptide (TPR) repeat protein
MTIMTIIKCKMCGGDIELAADKTFGICECCGSTMTLPKVDDEQRAAAFNRGNHFRRMGEFDKALAVYERMVQENDTDAEAHWCCALCRFGIEYVEDPTTYEWLPTCHRASFDSFLEDVDYLAAVEHSDGITRRQYQKDAAKIAEVQKGILATSQNEEPFDVFICYKESVDKSQRTRDSILAQEIYYQLTEEGKRVFFARITLENKAGTEYEPYIFAALNSAKVMVVVGTCAEHFNAVWVKNEWSRFLALMRKDRKKLLLPCYRDMDPYDLPEQLSVLQSYDMSKIGFMQDLIRGISKVVDADKAQAAPVKETVVVQSAGGSNVDALLKRGNMALEDHEWDKADGFFEEVLNQNAECAGAYLGKAMAGSHCASGAEYTEHCMSDCTLINSKNFQRALRFATGELKTYLKQLDDNGKAAQAERAKKDELDRIANIPHLAEIRACLKPVEGSISLGELHIVGLKSDGTVMAAGGNTNGECEVSAWDDIIAIGSCIFCTFGLKSNGTIVTAGDNILNQYKVSAWRNIIAISIGYNHIVGLQSKGTVVAVGDNTYGQCNVSTWHDIVAIFADTLHTVGLKSNGTVVATGFNEYGQCDVLAWHDISTIYTDSAHTIGLKLDGTVVAVGNNEHGQCNVSTWHDIVGISSVYNYVVGLKSDGTVVAVGDNEYGQCDVSTWRDIVAISAYNNRTVGLKSDGTVVAVGNNECGACDVSTWRDVVAITTKHLVTIGVKSDGTVIAVGDNKYDQCNVAAWKLFNSLDTLEEERREAAARRKAAEQKRQKQIQKLQAERRNLEEELSSVKLAFAELFLASDRRRKIEARLQEIERSLSKL